MVVTIDGSAKNLPRVGQLSAANAKQVSASTYRTSDGTYQVDVRQSVYQDGVRRAELMLRKRTLDTDSGTAYTGYISTGVGIVLEFGPYGSGSADLSNVRTAVLALVDSALQGRLVTGEN